MEVRKVEGKPGFEFKVQKGCVHTRKLNQLMTECRRLGNIRYRKDF
jgi:hypothetical protein